MPVRRAGLTDDAGCTRMRNILWPRLSAETHATVVAEQRADQPTQAFVDQGNGLLGGFVDAGAEIERGALRMPFIFLCNRGGGSDHFAGRLGDRLRYALGQYEVMQPFEVDPAKITSEAAACHTLLVVLGPGAQFPDPQDPIRLAIESALPPANL